MFDNCESENTKHARPVTLDSLRAMTRILREPIIYLALGRRGSLSYRTYMHRVHDQVFTLFTFGRLCKPGIRVSY